MSRTGHPDVQISAFGRDQQYFCGAHRCRSLEKRLIVLDGHLDRFLIEELIYLELDQDVVHEARAFHPFCGKSLLGAVPKGLECLIGQQSADHGSAPEQRCCQEADLAWRRVAAAPRSEQSG
jgi:hypothetical protein